MCLAIKKGQAPKIAEEDIVCYKVIRRLHSWITGMQELKYETPYRDIRIEFPKTYDESHKTIEVAPGCEIFDDLDGQHFESVNGNSFHSFARLSDAKWEAADWNWIKDDKGNCAADFVVIKCIIPKGAKYYEGQACIFNHDIQDYPIGYASNMITYTDTVYTVKPKW